MASRPGPKCGGKLHGRDGTCTLPAGWGTDHKGFGRCRKHLGNAPTVAKAAKTEQLEHELRTELARFDVVPVENPLVELQKLGGEVLAWKEAIGRKVNELTQIRYKTEHGEQLRAEVALYERAVDRLERVLVSLARLDIDQRLAAIEEAKGRLIIAAVVGGLADIKLSGELQQAARTAISRRLRMASAEERERAALPAGPGEGRG